MREFLNFFIKNVLKNNFNKDITLKDNPLVNIIVIKKIDYKRYELIINNKKLICISQKNLGILNNYWGNISQDENGITTISNLQKQPNIFQNNNFFSFDIDINKISQIIDSHNYKKKFLNFLGSKKDMEKNLSFYNQFIYLLGKDIVTISFIIKAEKIFSQFQIIQNKFLNEKMIRCYFAFKSFGPFEVILKERNSKFKTEIFTGYKSSLKLFDMKSNNFIFKEKDKIEPIEEISSFVLDIKG